MARLFKKRQKQQPPPPEGDQQSSELESEYVLTGDDAGAGALELGLSARGAGGSSSASAAAAAPHASASASAPVQTTASDDDDDSPEKQRRPPQDRQDCGCSESATPAAPAAPPMAAAPAPVAAPGHFWWEDRNRPIVYQLIDYVRHRSWQKKLLTVLVVATCCVVYADLFGFFWDGKIHAGIQWFLGWMHNNSVGAVFAFIGMFVLTTLVFIPPSLLIFGAGFVFVDVYGFEIGIALAMAACLAGSTIGATIAFFRARYMMRDLVKLFARRYPLIRAVDVGLRGNGFRVMLLLRLCSVIPFSALNYIGGVTGVRWGAFTCSLIGLFPSTLLTVFLGATAGSLAGGGGQDDVSEEDRIVSIIWMSCIGACGLLAVAMTIYFARKELIKEMEREAREAEGTLGSSLTAKPRSAADEDWSENQTINDGGVETTYEEGVDDEEWFWVWA